MFHICYTEIIMQITLNKETVIKSLPFIGLTILFLLFFLNNSHWFWVELWFLLEICFLTAFTRTLPLKIAVPTILLGISIGFGAVYVIGSGFDLLGAGKTTRAFFIPLLEEVAKLLPLFVVFRLFGGIKRPRLNISDFIFLGTASGAGFSMLEKYFWDAVYFPFTYGPHLGETYFFSDALGVYAFGHPLGYVGHAAATVFIALGLGLSYQFLRAKKRYWPIPFVLTFLWIGLEHIFLNYYYTPDGKAFLFFSGGQWTPWIIFFSLLSVVLYELGKTIMLLKGNKKIFNKFKSSFKQIRNSVTYFSAWSVLRAINYLAWVKTK